MSFWFYRRHRQGTEPRRTRLFWQLFLTFGVVIAFGIGGTAILFNSEYRRITDGNLRITAEQVQAAWLPALRDYYIAHNRRWDGVAARLTALASLQPSFEATRITYRLVDADGIMIAQGGNWSDAPRRQVNPATFAGQTIVVDDQVIGTLTVEPELRGRPTAPRGIPPSPLPGAPVIAFENDPRTFQQQLAISFRWVAWSIALAALGFSFVVSRRISAPLARLTRAAKQVAGGDLQVAVPGSSILEIDTLAHAFNQMAAHLAHADQLRRNMTADVAHELRTPLTIIKGKLEGILDGIYPSTADHLMPVLEETTLLERLIDDLRVLSLAEAGQLPLYREELDVDDLLHGVAQSFTAAAASAQIAIAVDVVPGLPPIEADGQRLQQVLGNLVANSLRHTPPGGMINLHGTRVVDGIRMAVADTGSGIAADELPNIFDRFWRSDRARTHLGGGAGLGLAIARQLTEIQGGRIEAQSVLGKGTTIAITLPITGAHTQGASRDTAKLEPLPAMARHQP